ncbi:MAG: HAD family hydrolase [Gammaproteobacteria bacterium]|nr:HAD family hydrolase [Gammaproteobacteria bacterium]
MMRSWGSRSDTTVIDEPFYAYYLKETGIQHPMKDAIIDRYETNVDAVIKMVSEQPATGIGYQKHITTHITETMPLDWLSSMQHAFLIRHPKQVLKSYSKKRADVRASDLGYEQQQVVFDAIVNITGRHPVVIDSDRFLQNPKGQLNLVCDTLGIDFEQAMLRWDPGKRTTDGLWEAHWYDAVKRSTGFQKATPMATDFNDREQDVISQCLPYYKRLVDLAI